MKNISLSAPARTAAVLALLALSSTLAGCSKSDRSSASGHVCAPQAGGGGQAAPAVPGFNVGALARYAGADYSQSITVAEANTMIGSYLSSINYPAQDTAIRSFTFDADTLRQYLLDTSIVTLRFYVAHTPSYASASGTPSPYRGMTPGAITLVVAGLNNSDAVVRNRYNGVYEHMHVCPHYCAGNSPALIQ